MNRNKYKPAKKQAGLFDAPAFTGIPAYHIHYDGRRITALTKGQLVKLITLMVNNPSEKHLRIFDDGGKSGGVPPKRRITVRVSKNKKSGDYLKIRAGKLRQGDIVILTGVEREKVLRADRYTEAGRATVVIETSTGKTVTLKSNNVVMLAVPAPKE